MSTMSMASPQASGKLLALERLRRYGVPFDEEMLLHSESVDKTVNTAVGMAEEQLEPGGQNLETSVGYLEFAAETAAFGAMTRVITGDHDMTVEEVRGLSSILKTIFDGLIVRR